MLTHLGHRQLQKIIGLLWVLQEVVPREGYDGIFSPALMIHHHVFLSKSIFKVSIILKKS